LCASSDADELVKMALATQSSTASVKEAFFKVAMAVGITVAGLEIGYLLYSPLPYDPVGYLVGRDFVNTWVGGELALSGHPQSHFAVETYNALLAQKFGPNYPLHIWSYPPHFLLFTWPLALLPYATAYVLYSLAGLIVYLAVASEGRWQGEHLVLLVLAPAVTVNIWCGQNGFFTAALLIGGLLQLDRRPILAGVLFGALSVKPQLGVLLPIMLALTGRWRTITAATATALGLLGLTCLVFGMSVWTGYVNDAMPTQAKVFLRDYENFMVHMPTVFMNARVAGAPLALAFLMQAVVSFMAVVASVWTFWTRRDPVISNALLVTATFLATPYAFNYDMVIFGWVIISLLNRNDNDRWDYGLMLAVWAIPFATVPLGIAGVPISSLPLLAFGARLLWRLRAPRIARAGTEEIAEVRQLRVARAG
jgi:alpha-1,2-mannosyltransferase